MKRILAAVMLCMFSLIVTNPVRADYPTGPVQFIVPWPPGDFEDILTRMIAKNMQEATGVSASVVNRPGGGDGPFPGALEVLEQKMCHGVGAAASISDSLTRLVPRKSPTGPGAPFRIKMSAASWSGWLGQCRSSQARHRRAASSTASSRPRAGQSARPTSQSSRLW